MNRQLIPPQYAPYESESESESESKYTASSSSSYYNSDSDNETDVPDIPNYKAFAEYLNKPEKESPNYPVLKQDYQYGQKRAGGRLEYSEYTKEETKPIEYAKTAFKTANKNATALISLTSRDRDRIVFPQPTLTTLRLPRLYRNVTRIDLANIKFLTSFYYFRPDKQNLGITILEKGRTVNNVITAGSTIISSVIRVGTYNINTLLSEIQTQLNRTPLFYDYVNGISDFANAFASTGDFGLNFNEPGDNFYDNVKDDFVQNPTKNLIVGKFWQVRYANRASYTFDQILIAYYYPPLKEFLLDEDFTQAEKDHVLSSAVTPNVTSDPNSPNYMATPNDVQERVLYTFQGIDDAVILAVIRGNTDHLDNYRTKHTFRFSLVNKYSVGLDTQSQRVVINTTGLNTSLSNLLTSQYQRAINQAINSNGFTPQTYSTLVNNNDKLGAVIRDLYIYEQNAFRDVFAIPYDSYSLEYYANLSNTILVKNGENAINIPANTAEAFSSLGVNYGLSTDVLNKQRVNPPGYWPHVSSVGSFSNDTIYSVNLSSSTENYNYPYIMTGCNFNSNYSFIDASGFIFRDRLSGTGNCILNIEPLQYSVFKIHSPVRQTLQIETLPRPIIYRLPEYNAGHPLYSPLVRQAFDNSYCYIDLAKSENLPYNPNPLFSNDYPVIYDNLKNGLIYEVPWWDSNTALEPNHWLADYDTSVENIVAPPTTNQGFRILDINVINQSLYYHFRTPYFEDAQGTEYKYRYEFNLEIEFSNANLGADTFTAFLYHDRAGFQADTNMDFRFRESSRFFKQSTIITSANVNNITMTFDTFEGQDYYIYLRPDGQNFGSVNARIVPYFDPIFSTTVTENREIVSTFSAGFDALDDYEDIVFTLEDEYPDFTIEEMIQRSQPVFGEDFPTYYQLYSTLYNEEYTTSSPTLLAIQNITGLTTTRVNTYYPIPVDDYNNAGGDPTLLSTTIDSIISTTMSLFSTPYVEIFPIDFTGYYVVDPEDTSYYYMRRLPIALPGNLTQDAQGIVNLVNEHKNSELYHYEGSTVNTYTGPEFYLSNYNYASIYDPAYLRLPALPSTLWTPDPTTADATRAVQTTYVPLGYDVLGVSDDYTDYMPFIAGTYLPFNPEQANIGIDPITRYQFQSNAPYNDTIQKFISTPGYTSSAIFVPGLDSVYYNSSIQNRDVKLVHYYSPNFIPEPNGNPADVLNNSTILVSSLISTTSLQRPYTVSTTRGFIQGYEYDPQGNLQLGSGPIGFSLIPPDGIWEVERFTFRSALYQSNSNYDPNSLIKYLAVFPSYDVADCNFNDVKVSSAIQLLRFTGRQSFSPDVVVNQDDFDLNGGTYYLFQKDSNFVSDFPGRYMGGFTQSLDSITNRTIDMYNMVAYDASFNIVRIKGMSGSVIPYPFYNEVSTSMTYLDDGKTFSYDPTFNPTFGMVWPITSNQAYNGSTIASTIYIQESNWLPDISGNQELFAPPSGNNGTQSQYVLSQPIGTSVVPYALPFDIYIEQKAFYNWNTYTDLEFTEFDKYFQPKAINANPKNYLCVQDTDYRIYYYPTEAAQGVNLTDRTFSPARLKFTLSADEIFSPTPFPETTPRIDMVAYAGNTSRFVFMGLEDTGSTMKAHFRFLFPNNGLITIYTPPTELHFNRSNVSIERLTWNDSNDYAISVKTFVPASNRYTGQMVWSHDGGTTVSTLTLPGLSTMIHSQDPVTRYMYVMPLNENQSNYYDYGNTYYKTDTTPSTWPGRITYITPKDSNSPSEYSDIIHNNNAAFDEIFCTTRASTFNEYTYRVRFEYQSTVSTFAQIDRVATHFYSTDPSGIEIDVDVSNTVVQLAGGPNNGRWTICNKYPYIWGNRNIFEDLEFRIGSAWQIFYPFQNVQLRRVNANYHPITDLSYIEYPEYPHVASFYYRNEEDFGNDVYFKWGLENSNNFKVGDVDMRGYEFNSYIYNVPLISSSGTEYQYLAIRNYSPTEKSQVLMRFFLPNLYDYGYLTFNELIGEIALHSTLQSEELFNPVYAQSLTTFDAKFDYKQTSDISGRLWGANLIPNFEGSNFRSSFVNYQSYASTYVSLFNTFSTNAAIIAKVVQSGNDGVNNFISSQLKFILPASALKRQRFTDPLTFSILWKDSLTPQFAPLTQEWGLGWNLGYEKANTPFSTVARGSSFYKIIDDYVYLRLNPELNMNRIDTGAPEDLQITREATGQVKAYFGKLILSDFGKNATTIISLPIEFNPPLGKLETLSFQWVNSVGVQLDNADCDWSCTVNVTEQKNEATADSTFLTGRI